MKGNNKRKYNIKIDKEAMEEIKKANLEKAKIVFQTGWIYEYPAICIEVEGKEIWLGELIYDEENSDKEDLNW